MTKIELLEMLTKRARVFRADRDHYKRNSHMHAITKAPPQEVVDAILTGFINDIGIMQGVDYALYARDLAESPTKTGETTTRACLQARPASPTSHQRHKRQSKP